MKKIFVFFVFCLLSASSLRSEEINVEQFQNWWTEFRKVSSIPPALREMEDHYVSSALINDCSKFWLFLNKKNIEQIANQGFENFKQTVACNYFTWLVNSDHVYSRNLFFHGTDFLQTLPLEQIEKKHDLFTHEQSIQYNKTTAMLYHFLMKNGAKPYLEKLDEPILGNTPSIAIQGKMISQDILNSLLEYLSLELNYGIAHVSSILEVGAGSGRTAHCFLQFLPNVKYIVVDIPPALYLSQTYLSSIFPQRKIFRFRPFQSFEEIQEEFQSATLLFLTPDQMKMLPDNSVDLFLAIDCLHEMKRDVVQFFFRQADRLASLFYFKCWTDTVIPFDEIHYPFKEYPIPTSWKKIFEGNCFVPSEFSHAFYQVR